MKFKIPSLEEIIGRRKRVLEHLMKSLEAWRGSQRISMLDESHLTEEEKELKHAYDLLQQLIADAQKTSPGQVLDVTA